MKTIAIRIFPLVFVCLLQSFSLCAQEPLSPETEYSRIRSLAFEGKLPEAETAALILLDSFPSYGDAVVLLARIYAWQQKYEPAGILLDSLLKNEPLNYDALDAKLDLSLWNGDYPYAVSFADSILSSFPADSAIMEKKMRAIAAMESAVKTDSMDILPVSSADTIPAAPAEKPEPGKTDLRLGYNFDTFYED